MKAHEFIHEVQDRLNQRIRHQYRRKKRAGILLPFIFPAHTEPKLLLTRRTEKLSSHKGEVAFPGGMMDDSDHNIVATALREADEEVGLTSDKVKVIGQLDDLISKNVDVMVTPTIGVITEPPPHWTPNPNEVARVFEIPLTELYQANRWRIEHKVWKHRSIQIYYFDFDGETLWGLSAYATLLALDLTDKGSPIDLGAYYRQIEQVRGLIKEQVK